MHFLGGLLTQWIPNLTGKPRALQSSLDVFTRKEMPRSALAVYLLRHFRPARSFHLRHALSQAGRCMPGWLRRSLFSDVDLSATTDSPPSRLAANAGVLL